jgi:hypothetical protein
VAEVSVLEHFRQVVSGELCLLHRQARAICFVKTGDENAINDGIVRLLDASFWQSRLRHKRVRFRAENEDYLLNSITSASPRAIAPEE